MRKTLSSCLMLLIFLTTGLQSQDLSDVRICIDPGHGGHESDDRFIPETGFWESESNLTKGLELRSILLGLGAAVAITRTGNSDVEDDPSLSQRAAIANAFNADFFNSNHSNGFNGTANYSMVIFNGTTANPTFPLAKTMANLMAPLIRDVDYTTSSISIGDLTLNPDWSFGYGVLVPANMPATISEGSFHDYIPESWRLMNLTYRKHEARALARSYLDYFDEPGFPTGAIAGVIRDPDHGVDYFSMTSLHDQYLPINQVDVQIEPGGLLYHGDGNNNGYFCRDSLAPGEFQVIVTALGYSSDTTTVTVHGNQTSFANFYLNDIAPPYVVASYPADGDTLFPAWNIPYIDFSKAMDVASVEAAFSTLPDIEGTVYFTPDQKRMAFIPADTMLFVTDFTFTIGATATDLTGRAIDGNHDGIAGDDWSINFRTSPPDNIPPVVLDTYPVSGDDTVSLRPIFNIVWDEELGAGSILDNLVRLERLSNLQVQETTLEHHVINGQSVLVLYSTTELLAAEPYRVRIMPGFKDIFGNTQGSGSLISFATSNYDYTVTSIDNFENDALLNWSYITSGLSTGFIPGQCSTAITNHPTVLSEGSATALQLDYGWDQDSDAWLLQEYLNGGLPRGVHFDANHIMQAYVFGDGSGNKFRFCVADDITGSGSEEVSPWYTVDWIGWHLVSWDMSNDGTGSWLGDGNLDGSLEYNSIQLTHTPGQPTSGTYLIDELRIVDRNYLALDESLASHPVEFALLPNYPNPFNPWTNVPFTLPTQSDVTINIYDLKGEFIATLINGSLEPGYHVTRWNAEHVASGIYLMTLKANDTSVTHKLTVLK